MAVLTENEIIDIIYSLYETDDEGWDTDSSEYLSARVFCNAAIQDWAARETWRDLWGTLAAATDGDKTITAGDYSYDCPTNFQQMGSWVRTVNNDVNTFWKVIPPEKVAKMAGQSGKFCYVTGSIKGGFDLNFNSEETLTTGDTISYEYYKTPTLFTATTSTSEIPDPYYLVYYALVRMLKNDGEDFTYEEQMRREVLDKMLTNNMTTPWDISNGIETPLNLSGGFGVGGGYDRNISSQTVDL